MASRTPPAKKTDQIFDGEPPNSNNLEDKGERSFDTHQLRDQAGNYVTILNWMRYFSSLKQKSGAD
jgi:hypothetical protein